MFVFPTLKADSHIACRAHAVPLPCCAAKRLECVFPIWFTQCGRVWFTLAMPRLCHALGHAVLLKATAQHGLLSTAVLWPWEERHGRSMAWVNKPLLLHLVGCLYYLYFIILFWGLLNNLNLTPILKTCRIWRAPSNASSGRRDLIRRLKVKHATPNCFLSQQILKKLTKH